MMSDQSEHNSSTAREISGSTRCNCQGGPAAGNPSVMRRGLFGGVGQTGAGSADCGAEHDVVRLVDILVVPHLQISVSRLVRSIRDQWPVGEEEVTVETLPSVRQTSAEPAGRSDRMSGVMHEMARPLPSQVRPRRDGEGGGPSRDRCVGGYRRGGVRRLCRDRAPGHLHCSTEERAKERRRGMTTRPMTESGARSIPSRTSLPVGMITDPRMYGTPPDSRDYGALA